MATSNCAWRHSATPELEWDGLLALVIDHVASTAADTTIINASNAIPKRLLVVTLETLDPLSEVHLLRSWCGHWESWATARDQDRRVLVEELVEWTTVLRLCPEVNVTGAHFLNPRYVEVGLDVPDMVGVGDPTQPDCHQVTGDS